MKRLSTYLISDRSLPVEGDVETDVVMNHEMVGKIVEVSKEAGGSLIALKGYRAEVTGVFLRFGKVVGYRVKIKDKVHFGSGKDFYTEHIMLEDIQPPTAVSENLKETLSHWGRQRDYWKNDPSGLESICFSLASITTKCDVVMSEKGWEFTIPGIMGGESASALFPYISHDSFWSTSAIVFPERKKYVESEDISDHWERVFTWAMKGTVPAWESRLASRQLATRRVLVPMSKRIMEKALSTKYRLTKQAVDMDYSIGFSSIRLLPNTVGLNEPPTDRRPYTVISVLPSVAKDMKYLEQVVMHECIHAVVGSNGGEPHNSMFKEIAKIMGLEPKYRD
jgi:hypothetical protein